MEASRMRSNASGRYGPLAAHDADPLAVRAVAEAIAEIQPDQVRDVEDA